MVAELLMLKTLKRLFQLGMKNFNKQFIFINENLIFELSKVIGAQSIVVSIDIIRHNNKYYLFDYLENSQGK